MASKVVLCYARNKMLHMLSFPGLNPAKSRKGSMSRICLVLMIVFFARSPLTAQTISSYVRSNLREASIEIDAGSAVPYRIPRTIYGTFLENNGTAIFGGLSAELLDNPSLEGYDASLAVLHQRFSSPDFERASSVALPLPWLPLDWEEGRRYQPRLGNAANSNRYLYLMGLSGKEVGIRQAVYLPIERERNYRGELFVSSSEGSQTVRVSFRRRDEPNMVLVAENLETPPASGWHKLTFQLELPQGAVAPLEQVDFAVSINGNHRISIDEILLYPDDAVDGLDPEVIADAKALHSPILRYGGNFTSSYHWEDGIGPVDQRQTMPNAPWGIPDYNLFGTDELMTLSKLIGARPQICLNLGSGSVLEARTWVEYLTAPSSTPMGALRARNGHSAPYDVAAWELGNELWNNLGWQSPGGYADRYNEFYDAIRELVPQNVMIFATGGNIDSLSGRWVRAPEQRALDFYRDWNAPLINRDGPKLQYLTTHFVDHMDGMFNQEDGLDSVWEADLAHPVGIGRALGELKAQIDSNPATRGRVKLAYTEWLFTAPKDSLYPRFSNLGGALVAAGWMNMLLENAAFVPVANMSHLVELAGIHKQRGRVFVTPQYWTLWLYSNFAGDIPIATRTTVDEYDVHHGLPPVADITDVPWLDVFATRNSSSGDLVLFVVNRDWRRTFPASIRLRDFNPATKAVVRTLTAGSFLEENDEINPGRVHPVTTSLQISGNPFHYEFPEHSLTVITMEAR